MHIPTTALELNTVIKKTCGNPHFLAILRELINKKNTIMALYATDVQLHIYDMNIHSTLFNVITVLI